MVLQHKIEDVIKQSDLLWKSIFGLTVAKYTNKTSKGMGDQQVTNKDVYNDLDAVEEAI